MRIATALSAQDFSGRRVRVVSCIRAARSTARGAHVPRILRHLGPQRWTELRGVREHVRGSTRAADTDRL